MVSSGVIVSLILVKVGFEAADGVVALLVAVVIFRTAWGIFRGVLHTLGDAARLPADEVADVAVAVPGVVEAHGVRTRGPESQVAVDLHVQVDPETTVARGHVITHEVEDALRKDVRADHRRRRAPGARGRWTGRRSSGGPGPVD